MALKEELVCKINIILNFLIENSLSDSQYYPVQKSYSNGYEEVSFRGSHTLSQALRERSYIEIYKELEAETAYTARLLDGGLLQFMYLLKDGCIYKHRLAFLPSPELEHFQNEPEIYLEEDIYADCIAKNLVPFPIRFDFDLSPGTAIDIEHPVSHLTLGSYKNCRIPVTSPLMPEHFLEFILRNFYNTAYNKFSEKAPRATTKFAQTITTAEKGLLHFAIP